MTTESIVAVPLHGADAQPLLQRAIRTLKDTGFWHATPAHRDLVLHLTADGTYRVEPQDGDRVVILIGDGVQATILERTNPGHIAIDLLVGENATITYVSVSEASVTATRFAHLARDASIRWLDVADGTHVDQHTITYLAGTGADASFASCFLGTGGQSYRVNSEMIHAGNGSTSNMLTRAALLDKSTGSYDGLIRILPHAKGCDAYQRGEFLLLSPDARMRAEPNLEIGNPEVKCSHGVSLTRVDEEQLFYFLARGIPVDDARRLIVEGFFAKIIDRLPSGAQEIKQLFSKRVSPGGNV